MAKYELLVPMRTGTKREDQHKAGDKIELDEGRAAELIAAGAVRDPKTAAGKRGGPTVAPGGTAAPSDPEGSGSAPEGDQEPTEPAKSASREDWAAYAKAKGAPADELEGDKALKRDELAAKYGTPSS